MRVEFRDLVNAMSTGNNASVMTITSRVQRKTNERVQTLRAAQQNFAKANNLKIQ